MRWNVAVAALAASWGLIAVIVRAVDLDAEALVFDRLVLAALALLAGLALARAIARPLSQLAASAEAMAQGRLDEPVPERRDHREAAVLSAALARLQSALTRAPSPVADAAPPPQPAPRPWSAAKRRLAVAEEAAS